MYIGLENGDIVSSSSIWSLHSRRQCDFEEFGRDMFLIYDIDHAGNEVRMITRHIHILMQIHGKIIKMRDSPLHDKFPVTHPHGNLVRLVKLPVKELVSRLASFIPGQSGSKGDAVKPIIRAISRNIGLWKTSVTYQFTESGDDVVPFPPPGLSTGADSS